MSKSKDSNQIQMTKFQSFWIRNEVSFSNMSFGFDLTFVIWILDFYAPYLYYITLNYFLKPVPEGINFPIITFSLSPLNLSFFPSREALIRTLEVS